MRIVKILLLTLFVTVIGANAALTEEEMNIIKRISIEMHKEKVTPDPITEENKIKTELKKVFVTEKRKDNISPIKTNHTINGDVSFYGGYFHGRQTANGSKFDQWGLTAAHKTLPFGTKVRVTNKANNKSVIVTITDRGPYIKGRTFDLSKGSFLKIASEKQGILKRHNVLIEILSIPNKKKKNK